MSRNVSYLVSRFVATLSVFLEAGAKVQLLFNLASVF